MPDVKTLYRVPLLLQEDRVLNILAMRLNLTLKCNYDQSLMVKWRDLIERYFLLHKCNAHKKKESE